MSEEEEGGGGHFLFLIALELCFLPELEVPPYSLFFNYIGEF